MGRDFMYHHSTRRRKHKQQNSESNYLYFVRHSLRTTGSRASLMNKKDVCSAIGMRSSYLFLNISSEKTRYIVFIKIGKTRGMHYAAT